MEGRGGGKEEGRKGGKKEGWAGGSNRGKREGGGSWFGAICSPLPSSMTERRIQNAGTEPCVRFPGGRHSPPCRQRWRTCKARLSCAALGLWP